MGNNMEELITFIKGLNIFWLEWIPAFILLVFIGLSLLSLLVWAFKKSIKLIILIIVLNLLASYGIFEYLNKLLDK